MKPGEMERDAVLALLPAAIERLCAGKPRRCIPRREDDDDAVVERALELLRSERAEGDRQRELVEGAYQEGMMARAPGFVPIERLKAAWLSSEARATLLYDCPDCNTYRGRIQLVDDFEEAVILLQVILRKSYAGNYALRQDIAERRAAVDAARIALVTRIRELEALIPTTGGHEC